ncbi:hypothetical protein THRCLA_02180 [Thraustotheca clavata]|uniref:Helicase-associated domain-containing protein n=1 Tax=Thraustotheca clavata TaxID=74557 RepID=A0A1W0A613_9STRA|nr:hypothetical protein THRCLA_02180 [Thraustotheca clavata]
MLANLLFEPCRRWCHSSIPNKYRDIVQVVRIEREKTCSKMTYLPSKYTVPHDDAFPIRLQGRTLMFSDLRRKYGNNAIPFDVVQALNNYKFVWKPREYLWMRNLMALQTYVKLYGDLLVVRDFKVPSNDPAWPPDTWNINLGLVVLRLRHDGPEKCPPERKSQLDALGFVWDWYDDLWNSRIKALEIYKSVYGNLAVPFTFVVPENDTSWPPEMWNTRLGITVNTIRQHIENCPPERKFQLDQMGFVWDCMDENWNVRIKALTMYKQIYGDLLIAHASTIPDNDTNWPQELWGMKLGISVKTIRHSAENCPPERKAQLDAMGFVWNRLDDRWSERIQAFTIYKQLHGDVAVRYSYCIPENDENWPKSLWNMKLGVMARNIRKRVAQCPPERKAQLDALGFNWNK